ncbi:MAG: hypothetical protein L0154_13565 [Chloroflexi bacterium]|nr:hypothetical protein [Chloroflexota bacterium]
MPAGYTFQTRTAIIGGDQVNVGVIYYRADIDDPLNVSQIRGEENSTTFGVGSQATVVEVVVNGGSATFIGDAFVDYSDSQNPDRELWIEPERSTRHRQFSVQLKSVVTY